MDFQLVRSKQRGTHLKIWNTISFWLFAMKLMELKKVTLFKVLGALEDAYVFSLLEEHHKN